MVRWEGIWVGWADAWLVNTNLEAGCSMIFHQLKPSMESFSTKHHLWWGPLKSLLYSHTCITHLVGFHVLCWNVGTFWKHLETMMSSPPSKNGRSGKNELYPRLEHKRNTKVQLIIRQQKNCILSLPSAQAANELLISLPERFHWPFLGSAQITTSVRPSVGPTAQPFLQWTYGMNWNSCCCRQATAGLPATKWKLQANQMLIFMFQKKTVTEQNHHHTFFECIY